MLSNPADHGGSAEQAADGGGPNAIGTALGLLGDEWTLLVVREVLQGVGRFGELRTALGISDAVLADRLARLVDAGLLRTVRYSERPPRHAYALEPAGAGLWQVLVAVWAWEAAWADHQGDPLPVLRHAGRPGTSAQGCGELCEAELTCAACGAVAADGDVGLTPGPAGGAARAVPTGSTRRRPTGSRGARTAGAVGLFPETMALVGNRWSAAMLGSFFLNSSGGSGSSVRFTDLQDALQAPPATVADRLRALVGAGVVTGLVDEGRGGPYRLTAKGRAAFGVVATIVTWAERWFPVAGGPALLAVHHGCGSPFRAALACSVCHGRLSGGTVGVEQVAVSVQARDATA